MAVGYIPIQQFIIAIYIGLTGFSFLYLNPLCTIGNHNET